MEKLISYDIAVLAKNKGVTLQSEYFYVENQLHSIADGDECLNYFDKDYKYINSLFNSNGDFWFDEEGNDYLPIFYYALSQTSIQKWLREIHNINIEIIGFVDSPEETTCYFYHLRDMTKYSTLLVLPDSDENTFDTYEETLETALKLCLTLI